MLTQVRAKQNETFKHKMKSRTSGNEPFTRGPAMVQTIDEKILKLSGVFFDLGMDSENNIAMIVRRACETIGGTCSLYSSIDEDGTTLRVKAGHQTPSDLPISVEAAGHICFEEIIKGRGGPVQFEDLHETRYLHSDPRVRTYGIRSYLAAPVVCGGEKIGSLCILDSKKRLFSDIDIHIISTLAKALSLEEDRRQIQEASKKSERDKELILANLKEHVIYQNSDMSILWANRAACESVGLSPGQLVGRHCYEIWACRDDVCPDCPVAAAMATGKPHEIQKQTPDGRAWSIRGYPVRDGRGTITGGVEVTLEITDQYVEQQARQESEERFRQIAENIGEVVWMEDAEHTKVLYVNPAYERVFGVTVESAYDDLRNWENLVHPDDRDVIQKLLRSNSSLEEGLEYRIRTRENTLRWIRSRVFPIYDAGGTIYRYVGIAEDITRKKEAEKSLKESEERLLQSQKMEAVGRLAGGIAHDFNNLLTAILGYTEMIQLNVSPDETTGLYVQEIKKASERAARLTQQLLAFSRKQILEPKKIDLNRLIIDLQKMLPRLLGEDIHLQTKLGPEIGCIQADPGQIEQVILNLAVNARDAMPKGGELSIETSRVHASRERWLTKNDMNKGWWVRVRVGDTGHGMSQEVLKHIFEPFYTTKEKGKGTGLGLATVYGIVKQNGGQITVQSKRNRGTKFDIFFPILDGCGCAGAEYSFREESLQGQETVLVVEDEDAVRNLISQCLKEFGYTIFSAENGTEALNVCRENEAPPLHLLLTDVVMPDLSGVELARRIREIKPDIRTLFISGYTNDTVENHGVLRDGAYFLQKPFTPIELARMVRMVLSAQS
jgi:two-component system cell cycle sensor histidine kinase/response regulator CckA